MWIKADYNALLNLSEAMYVRPQGSVSKYLFSVLGIDGLGYCEWTEQIENNIAFEYEVVSEIPLEE